MIKILINNARYLKPFFLGHRWINNQRKSNSVWYNTPHWKIIALICCARRSPKVTLITVFVSIVVWKQARWPPPFITFLISPCLVTSTYQVSSEIYGGFFYWGITLIEHDTGIRGGHRFQSRWSPDFFRLRPSNCLNWKIYCTGHS